MSGMGDSLSQAEQSDIPTYHVTGLPSDPALWPRWRKKVVTSAVRIDGPFRVLTSEGPLTCDDGYLAVDARGYPYPIAVDEFRLIYEPEDRRS